MNKLTTVGVKNGNEPMCEALSTMIEWLCPVVPADLLLCFLTVHLVFCLCSWLLSDSSMRLRTTHPGFTQAVNTFFDKLIPKMVPLQVSFQSLKLTISLVQRNLSPSFLKYLCYLVQERRSHYCRSGGKWLWILCEGWKLHAFHNRGNVLIVIGISL